MRKILNSLITTSILIITATSLFAQMAILHGDESEIRKGVHNGNQFHVTFCNDGTFGSIDSETDIAGEWPAGTGRLYLYDGNLCAGSEVIDNDGFKQHIVSTVRSANILYSTGDQGPHGEWYTFLPLPGFANENLDHVAMSHIQPSWPAFWPDKWDDPVDPGWANSWNGYFGKNQFNADQESYFVADDYANREFNFFPDANDPSRGGLGLRMIARGFQWSFPIIEDLLFLVFDFENIGTYEHDKMVFGYKIGNDMGTTEYGYDAGDDSGDYDREENLAYLFDENGTGYGGWGPVGYFGAAFLETPGNPCDGIDNDNDGKDKSGIVITTDMFLPRVIQPGDDIILIDYQTWERTKTTMQSDPIVLTMYDHEWILSPGDIVEEIPYNMIDDNLNGLIDENNGVPVGEEPYQEMSYLYTDCKAVDYFNGIGMDNPFIDERRDDGIDNDGDWDALSDDVGADGIAYTGDAGENNGQPTPGEPNFDRTDAHEADMLGLTSFNLYRWETIPLYSDEAVWNNLQPGYFNDLIRCDNTELFFGSGYFSLAPHQTERITMTLMCGESLDDLYDNQAGASTTFHQNYRLHRKPEVPALTAVAYNKKVTLNWNDIAEFIFDPVTGYDFEGYRIYKSMDPTTFGDPVIQFDLDNEYAGLSQIQVNGASFNLGMNTGLQHNWVDTDVEYGNKYYYIVTSYDHGSPAMGIAPSECAKNVYVDASGQAIFGQNGAIIVPVESSAKYFSTSVELVSGVTDGIVTVDIADPKVMKKGQTYQVTFEDSMARYDICTKNFTLTNITTGKILIYQYSLLDQLSCSHVLDGFRLSLQNAGQGLLELDWESSGWNNPGIYPYNFRNFSYSRGYFEPMAGDFNVVFGEVGMDTSTEFIRGNEPLPAIPVNFTINNRATGEKVKFAFRERDIADESAAGKFTGFQEGRGVRSDEIIFLTSDSLIASWQVSLMRHAIDTLQPGPGDTLFLKMIKPFLSQNVFEFTMPTEGTIIEAENKVLHPDQFCLYQNTPNPFNPVTTIKYGIPKSSRVRLKIFNLMGQEVATLVNGYQTAGYHQVQWDTFCIPSGVYIYRIQMGEYCDQKKMIVIK